MRHLLIGAALLAFAGEAAAQAPAGTCEGLKQLLNVNADTLKGIRGNVVKLESDKIAYVSKLQLPGFTSCKVTSFVKKDVSGFFNSDFECEDLDLKASEAATKYVEQASVCLKDLMHERKATDTLIGGAYRVTEWEGSVTPKGKAQEIAYDQEYMRFQIAKNFADGEEVSVRVYYYFAKQ